ncbi:MAG: tetratricopeptide repeat protein [Desulfobacterales bacterium]
MTLNNYPAVLPEELLTLFGVRKIIFALQNFLGVFIIGFSFFMAGCSVPQIIVLQDPLTPQEHLQLGLSYENRSQLDLAMKQYQKAASNEVPEAFLFMGNIAYRQENFDKAECFYRKAIKKIPEDPRAYNNLAWIYYEQGKDLKKAEVLARKALELTPPDNQIEYLDTLEKILSGNTP